MEKDRALAHLLKQHPVKLAHMLGYDLLREGLHDIWIRDIAYGKHDMTLQAHRGSYKTTSLEVALWVIMLTQPDKTVGFLRKSEADVSEVFSAVEKMLRADVTQDIAEIIYGRPVRITTASSTELSCDIACNVSGVSQVSGYGIGGSLTGKHWDIVCTDDIVTVRDRYSRAERERTKQVYRELQNVKNRGGRIVNTGTPWHKDDAFQLMPEPVRWPWDKTGLIAQKEAETLKKQMTRSLFAANYELRHVAEEGAVFEGECQSFTDKELLYDGVMHVDAAYGGKDGTAITCIQWRDGEPYVHGELYRETHVDKCMARILELHRELRLGTVYMEKNADKGYVADKLEGYRLPVSTYQETENKFIKISTFARGQWSHLRRLQSSAKASREYWDEVMDFTEGAEHDDAPDSLACAIRLHDNAPVIHLFKGGL